MSPIQVILRIIANLNLEIELLDMKTTFIHSDLEKQNYMEQPKDSMKVLKKTLHAIIRRACLKEVPR